MINIFILEIELMLIYFIKSNIPGEIESKAYDSNIQKYL